LAESSVATLFSESLRKREASQKYRDSLVAFSELLGFKNSSFHIQIYHLLEDMTLGKRDPYLQILAPRSSGKSTLCSVVYPLWCLVRNPDARIIIVSNTIQQAREWLREIEAIMLYHEGFKGIFGNLVPDARKQTWTDTEKIIRGRSPFATHLSLLAVGFGGALLGRRADLIVCDDVLDFEISLSDVGRDRAKAWFFETLVPVLEPRESSLVTIGTRWHADDLYGTLLKSWKGNCFTFQAIQPNGKALWPERWSLKKLEEIRQTIGSIPFSLQYQNIPLADKDAIFKENWLKLAPEIPDGLAISIGVDPCVSPGTKKSDYFAAAVLGRKGKETYILDLVMKKAGLKEQIQTIRSLNQEWSPVRITIESNTAQALIPQLLQEEELPIHPSQTQESKRARFIRLGSKLETGRVYWKSEDGEVAPNLKPLLEQLILYPNISHDDAADSLELAMATSDFVPPVMEVVEPPESEYNRNWSGKKHPLFFPSPRRNVIGGGF
jgi:predicted phage terminase large subunit-like protein